MSTQGNDRSGVRALPASANLESLKKEAKRWLKALRDGDSQALERLHRRVPTASGELSLREVQHALALEFKTESWTALKEVLADRQLANRSAAERADDFLRNAIDRQNGDLSAQILRKHPDVTRFSIHTAVVGGDLAEVQRRIASDASAASSIGGPNKWQPLQYLCYARIPVAQATDNSLVIARALLDAHADAKATFLDDWNNPFTLLTGVMGQGEQQHFVHPHAVELAALLIEHGAEPYDTQSLYNTSLLTDDTFWLEFLYARSEAAGTADKWRRPYPESLPETRMLDYLLGNAVSRNHLLRARWLLNKGARTTATHHYTKRNLHTEAELCGFAKMATLLREFGAKPELLTGFEALLAACMRCDREALQPVFAAHPEYLKVAHPMLAAAEHDLVEVVELLFNFGMSPNVGDGSWTALHSAANSGSMRVAKLLVERGAAIDVRETKYRATPLGHAIYFRRQAMVEYLSTISRDVFGLARTGNLMRLREVLDAEPDLARATHDGKTPLFDLSSPEETAIQIAELLLQRGCDPKVKDADGKTAGEIAAKYGFDDLAEILAENLTS